MKKKLLATAVAGLLAAPFAAQSVNLSPGGTGEVLIYPYYNVNEGNATFLSVVNTTTWGKILKVRFREGLESEDVLDFQLYLSPQDHWNGVVTQEGGSVVVRTSDSSCTVPTVKGKAVPFSANRIPASFTGNTLDRISEGHVEILEMAALRARPNFGTNNASTASADNDVFTAIKHSSGVPANCDTPSAWNTALNQAGNYAIISNGGVYPSPETTSAAAYMMPSNGGLYGLSAVFNPTSGVYYPYNAWALEDFHASTSWFVQVATPISRSPLGAFAGTFSGYHMTSDRSLVEGSKASLLAFDLPDLSTPGLHQLGVGASVAAHTHTGGGSIRTLTFTQDGTVNVGAPGVGTLGLIDSDATGSGNLAYPANVKRNAVTAALMVSGVQNDYLTGDAFNTDWVFTFPGRYLYNEDTRFKENGDEDFFAPDAPFQTKISRVNGQACETISSDFYDREEARQDPADVGFSPGAAAPGTKLCYEVNVISVNDGSADSSAALASKASRQDLGFSFTNGWADLGFTTFSLTGSNGVTATGLPFVGFAAISDESTDIEKGGTFPHKRTYD